MLIGLFIAARILPIPISENMTYVWLLELVVENLAMWGYATVQTVKMWRTHAC